MRNALSTLSEPLMSDLDTILNSPWWTQAIIDRHKLDLQAKAENRAHQMVDPDAHPPGPEHVMTPWARAWIEARVADGVTRVCTEGEAAHELLQEPEEEHEDRVADEAALKDFGARHEETIERAHAKKNEHDHRSEAAVQIDEHVRYVRRHRQTKFAEVREARRLAAEQKAKAELVVEKPFEEHVAHYVARVEAELLMHGLDSSPAVEVADSAEA